MFKVDLSGEWQVRLDPTCADHQPDTAACSIRLPGTTSAAGIGPENPARETGFLTDSHKFEGCAWFSRSFTAGEWQEYAVLLTLERTRQTTVYLDGEHIGSENSLATPHRYLLPRLNPGEHVLTICVNNTNYPTRGGHLTSKDTQSNWNGITGELSLTVGRHLLTDVHVRPLPDLSGIHVSASVLGAVEGVVTAEACGVCAAWPYRDGAVEGELPLPADLPRWDELSPVTHALTLRIGEDSISTSFGLRRFHAEGRRLFCNDREVFLRGKHDGLIFPLTGYAPTDVDSWRRTLQIAKDYGINHYRCHTCCPPDAALTAADELGIFFEPEIPFWGTVTEEGDERYDPRERAYLIREGFRILREYGHHPSFVMLSLGNELWGSKAAINRMLADYRAYDPDKLYISGSNNFQFAPDILAEEDVFVGVRFSRDRLFRGSYAMCDAPQGIVQLTEPESVTNYDAMILPDTAGGSQASGKVLIQYGTGVKEVDAEAAEALLPQIPVIAHEVGQYEFYPDFSEIDRYTGPLKARNYEVFRERLQAAGLWEDHERFYRSAGRLAADCYRRELETFLRTSELSGFQLLDLQDFTGQGTALVGVLNALMESKGFITPEEWRRFCAGTVVLGLLDRFVLASGDALRLRVQVSECDPVKQHTHVTCTLLRGTNVLSMQTVALGARHGRLTEPVPVDLGPVTATQTDKLTLRLQLEDGTLNEYTLWVFPEYDVTITPEGITGPEGCIRFVKDAAEAAACGCPAIVIPQAEGKLKAEYCTDFWCYPMFRAISESMGKPWPTGTLGLCIRPEDPLLAAFAPEDYTTPPWYRILAHAHCEPLEGSTAAIVEMIDNVERCARLGILYRKDGALHLTARLWEDAASPEVQAFAYSLLRGMNGTYDS